MPQSNTGLALQVVRGPIDLPIARYHVAVLGIGSRSVALALPPTTDIRATPFELDLHGPFSIAGTTFDQPAAVARQLDSLVGVGIVAARTTDLDGLELELMTGDILSAGPASWSLEAPDGRRWESQPGGGVALWEMDAGRGASDASSAIDDLDPGPTEVPVEVGSGRDLPGAGFHLVGLEVDVSGRLSLTLRPEGAGSAPEAVAEYDGPDVMEAFEFFATLNVGPGTIPPDPEVVEAMEAVIERSNFGLGEDVWIALDQVESVGEDAALASLGAMGSVVISVRIAPDGALEVELAGGPRLRSSDWWLQTSGLERWTGTDGTVVRRTWGDDAPKLSASDVAALAEAWLEHDRTGRKSQFWAWERCEDVVRRQPMTGWLLLRHLIAGAADEQQLMNVAAGPFEDLLAEHSQVLLDRIEEAARSDPRTMRALAGVWKSSIDEGDWARIQRLLGREAD